MILQREKPLAGPVGLHKIDDRERKERKLIDSICLLNLMTKNVFIIILCKV